MDARGAMRQELGHKHGKGIRSAPSVHACTAAAAATAAAPPASAGQHARGINRKLKRGKAFDAGKINGLLVASLDANEQFCSDHRCCAECLVREITCKDAQGCEWKRKQYYHKQGYAQLSGPQLSVILDVEPMRQGDEECAAALRLLRRMRLEYGPRFFDVVAVDSWHANGPFLKTVAEDLGWPVVAVLKQERYEIHQEIMALSGASKPAGRVERDGRQVEIRDVPSLRLNDTYAGPVRGVWTREIWTLMTQQRSGTWGTCVGRSRTTPSGN